MQLSVLGIDTMLFILYIPFSSLYGVQRTEYKGEDTRVWIQDPSFSRLDRQAGTIPIGLGRWPDPAGQPCDW